MKALPPSLFNIRTVQRKPQAGDLLVAEPLLTDRFFSHAVINLLEYDARHGAMGVVLNNATQYTLGQALDKVNDNVQATVYCGGPMSTDRLYFIHTLGNIFPGAREYAPGLYVGGDIDAMIDYVNSGYLTDGVIRFFVGYSGWGKGQLEDELAEHTWAVTDLPTDREALFMGSEDPYWHRTVKTMGEPYRNWLLHPQNPHSN